MKKNFLLFLTIIVGYFIYLTYKPYLFDILIAALMAISFGKMNIILSKKIKNRYVLSAIDTMLLSLLIFGPFLYFVIEFSKYITHLDPQIIKNTVGKLRDLLDFFPKILTDKIKDYLTPENINKIYQNLLPIIGTITQKSAGFIKDAFLIIVFFFFAVLYGKKILTFFKKIIPMEDKYLESMFFTTSSVMSVVFYSTILTSLLEGLLFGAIVSYYGLDFFFFLVMYAFSSLIPIIGGVIMWGPVSLYLYSIGNTTGAIIVALYSIIMISVVADTFVKPLIIAWVKKFFNSEVELNSLIIFFSIVAGLSSFGLWGIIIGPTVTTLFISILKFYEKETLKNFSDIS